MPLNLSQKRILEILSKHKDTDSVSKLCDRLLASLILLNLLAIILESVPAINTRFSTGFIIFELFQYLFLPQNILLEFGLAL